MLCPGLIWTKAMSQLEEIEQKITLQEIESSNCADNSNEPKPKIEHYSKLSRSLIYTDVIYVLFSHVPNSVALPNQHAKEIKRIAIQAVL